MDGLTRTEISRLDMRKKKNPAHMLARMGGRWFEPRGSEHFEFEGDSALNGLADQCIDDREDLRRQVCDVAISLHRQVVDLCVQIKRTRAVEVHPPTRPIASKAIILHVVMFTPTANPTFFFIQFCPELAELRGRASPNRNSDHR